MTPRLFRDILLAVLLLCAGAATRLIFQDLPNFAPVAALALFSGYLLRSRALALSVPLGAMFISDAVIGGYTWPLMVTVYVMLVLPVFLGGPLRRWIPLTGRRSVRGTLGLVGCSLASSLAFFAVTNLATWWFGGFYERTADGLWRCYVNAIPFFRYTVAGDLAFSIVLFGSLALVLAWHRSTVSTTAGGSLAAVDGR